MIISATPMIAGIRMLKVNTRTGGSRWGATKFTTRTKFAAPGKSNGCTKIKRRAARCWTHPTAHLDEPISETAERSPAMFELRAQVYANRIRRAVTPGRRSVTTSTMSVVDG